MRLHDTEAIEQTLNIISIAYMDPNAISITIAIHGLDIHLDIKKRFLIFLASSSGLAMVIC